MLGIDVRNASLAWQGHSVFSDLNFHLPAGEWTCLLGQSGVGKSSLLRLLAGLTEQMQVRAEIVASDGKPLDGRVAWMAQQDLLLPWLACWRTCCWGLACVAAALRQRSANRRATC